MDSVQVLFAMWLKKSTPSKYSNMQVLLKQNKTKQNEGI